MRLREIFTPDDSTVRICRSVYNLLIRAAVFTLAIVILAWLGIGLNFFLLQAALPMDLDPKTQTLVRASSNTFFIILAITTLMFSLSDILKLIWYHFSRRNGNNGH